MVLISAASYPPCSSGDALAKHLAESCAVQEGNAAHWPQARGGACTQRVYRELDRPAPSGADVGQITNAAFDRLHSSNLGAANLSSVVIELFSELTLNATQHSESVVGAFACVQLLESVTGGGGSDAGRSLIIANPPMRLSSKFEAIARSHRLSIKASPDGSWLLTAA